MPSVLLSSESQVTLGATAVRYKLKIKGQDNIGFTGLSLSSEAEKLSSIFPSTTASLAMQLAGGGA